MEQSSRQEALVLSRWAVPLAKRAGNATQRCLPPACAAVLQTEGRVGAAESAAALTGAKTPMEFVDRVVRPMLAMEGDRLPVR